MNKIFIIIQREYMLRVHKKGFIFSTLLMPILIIGLMLLPAVVNEISRSAATTVAVVDKTGVLASEMFDSDNVKYYLLDRDPEFSTVGEQYNMLLEIGDSAVTDLSDIRVYTYVDPITTARAEKAVRQSLGRAIEERRLDISPVENLREILSRIRVGADQLQIQTISMTSDTGSLDEMTASVMIGVIMALVLYMFIIIYGQQVMQSVIEEKSNRVLELIVTSIKPTQLMMGKILGIGAVALTQVAIWALIIILFVSFVLPGMAAGNPELQPTLAMFTSLSYISSLFGYLAVYLVGGFLLYASLYAAIGASVENVQDGSQLSMFVVIPVAVGMVFTMSLVENPDSTAAVWLSMIPFTSPMAMLARIPSGVDGFEIATSIAILYLSIAATAWFSAKIYRVGIFMYGKKPTIREILKWVRYR